MYTCTYVERYGIVLLAALAFTPTLQFSVAGVSLSGLVYTAQCHVVTWGIHETRPIDTIGSYVTKAELACFLSPLYHFISLD